MTGSARTVGLANSTSDTTSTAEKVCGERESIDEVCTDTWVSKVLIPTVQKYKEKGIFNMDECALVFRMLSDRTFEFKSKKCHG